MKRIVVIFKDTMFVLKMYNLTSFSVSRILLMINHFIDKKIPYTSIYYSERDYEQLNIELQEAISEWIAEETKLVYNELIDSSKDFNRLTNITFIFNSIENRLKRSLKYKRLLREISY